jgi:transcriptional regulator with XRE-family HTH domain
MSQAKLGALLGVTFQQVQKYERGTNRIGSGRLHKIAEALDVPVTFFFGGDKSGVTPRDPALRENSRLQAASRSPSNR